MPRLAANLSFLFREVDFLQRFAAAADAGFSGVEYLFPYEHDPAMLSDLLTAHGLTQALFNCPPGNWDNGERGIACLEGRLSEFEDGIGMAIDYATKLGCTRLHCMAGVPDPDTPREQVRETFVESLKVAARATANYGICVLTEPINTQDMPGYFLTRSDQALDIIADVGVGNVALQFDMYHAEIMQGRLEQTLRNAISQTRHIQIADVPGRNEPGTGRIDYKTLLPLLDTLGYEGWVGCEYKPSDHTGKCLGWAADYLTLHSG